MNKPTRLIPALSICFAIAIAVFLYTPEDANRDAGAAAPALSGTAHTANQAHPEPSNQWGASPFSNTIPVRENEAVRIAKRRTKMESGNYQTPPEYDTMNLAHLRHLARQGDVFAMVQLGEQYSSELEALQHDPAFEVGANPNRLAKHYFTQAIGRGHTHLVSVLASTALEKGDVAEAYAWHLVSEKFNDKDTDFHRRKAAFLNLSQEQLASALKKYEEVRTSLNLP
jgi:hypothetical protein